MPSTNLQLSGGILSGSASETTAAIGTENTHLAACLATMGVFFWEQVTDHIATGTKYITWNLAETSAQQKDLRTADVVKAYSKDGGPKLSDTKPLTDWPLHFRLSMFALESRRLMLEAEKRGGTLQMLRLHQNYSRLIRYQENMKDRDLIRLANDAALGNPSSAHWPLPTFRAIGHKKLVWAASILGFPPVGRTEKGEYILPMTSMLDPALTLLHLQQATAQIHAYHEKWRNGEKPEAPKIELPGYTLGCCPEHPFVTILNALYNHDVLINIVHRYAVPTFFLQNKANPLSSALVRQDAPGEALGAAVKHTGVKI